MNECFHDLKQIKGNCPTSDTLQPNLFHSKSPVITIALVLQWTLSNLSSSVIVTHNNPVSRTSSLLHPIDLCLAIATSRSEDQGRHIVHVLLLLSPTAAIENSPRWDWNALEQRPPWILKFLLWISYQAFWSSTWLAVSMFMNAHKKASSCPQGLRMYAPASIPRLYFNNIVVWQICCINRLKTMC